LNLGQPHPRAIALSEFRQVLKPYKIMFIEFEWGRYRHGLEGETAKAKRSLLPDFLRSRS